MVTGELVPGGQSKRNAQGPHARLVGPVGVGGGRCQEHDVIRTSPPEPSPRVPCPAPRHQPVGGLGIGGVVNQHREVARAVVRQPQVQEPLQPGRLPLVRRVPGLRVRVVEPQLRNKTHAPCIARTVYRTVMPDKVGSNAPA
jgi:hypothetical protein